MRRMRAKYAGRCRDCGYAVEVGDMVRWSKATGVLCGDEKDCRDYADSRAENEAELRMERWADSRMSGQSLEGYYSDEDDYRARREHYADERLLRDPRGELMADLLLRQRDEADYQRGVAEVREVQALTTAGSALREQMYMEMEQAAYNRGEDY